MRKPYPSDLTDQRWAIFEPLVPVPTVTQPRANDMREVLNAILDLSRSGCQWDMLPYDLPAKSTACNHFAHWRDDGTWPRIMDALRQGARVADGRERYIATSELIRLSSTRRMLRMLAPDESKKPIASI